VHYFAKTYFLLDFGKQQPFLSVWTTFLSVWTSRNCLFTVSIIFYAK